MTSAVPSLVLEKVKNAFDEKLSVLKSFSDTLNITKLLVKVWRLCKLECVSEDTALLFFHVLHCMFKMKHPYRGLNRENLLLCRKSPSRM